jgi:hypothetical protein
VQKFGKPQEPSACEAVSRQTSRKMQGIVYQKKSTMIDF